jgi:chloramphenicol-sensitive protein RarD
VSEERRGILYGVSAYLLWGLFPLYFPLLKPAKPLEILSHRVVWSLVFVVIVLLIRREWAWMRKTVGSARRLGLLLLAASTIAVNWGVYIWAVNNNHVVEASLGYFINPLVTVLLGIFLLHERLRTAQWLAVGLATVAVLVLTVNYGRLPWIALTLAFSFATYGLVKKIIGMPVIESLGVETALLFLPAMAYLIWLQGNGQLRFGHVAVGTSVLLALSGVITAVPLLMFGASAARVPLSTLGLLQYITPVIQFLIGVLVVHEALPPSRLAGFTLVWAALIVFTVDSINASRRRAAHPTEASAAAAELC